MLMYRVLMYKVRGKTSKKWPGNRNNVHVRPARDGTHYTTHETISIPSPALWGSPLGPLLAKNSMHSA